MFPNSPRILHWQLTIFISGQRKKKSMWQLRKEDASPLVSKLIRYHYVIGENTPKNE